MYLKKIKYFIIFTFLFFSVDKSFSNNLQTYPGTPSSSYNSEYYLPFENNSNSVVNFEKKIPLKKVLNNEKKYLIIGNFRLDKSVIIRDSKIESFETLDQKALSQCIKNLYKTGYFKDVKIFMNKNIINIKVEENPIINKISFEGNSEVKDITLSDELSLKEKNVYSSDKVKVAVLKVQNIYKRLGFFSTYVEPKLIRLEQNRVNLVFEIKEGLEAKIKKINFIGNKEFSDSTLSDVIYSEESRWYKFWGSGDKFDQDRLNYDKDLLKKYYFENGFIDFRILSSTSQLITTSKNFIINFKIFEGERYKLSSVDVVTSVKDFDKVNLSGLLTLDKGDWFNSKEIDKTIEKITEKASELGFAFVDVRPKIEKKKGNKVSLSFVVFEGQKIFVNRINIFGNIKTSDKVIRREISVSEGDAFNLSKINRSERILKTLGLFENVTVTYDQIPNTNKTNIDYMITEQSTGEFSVGAGFSSLDGALGNIGIKENNLFGEAKELALNLGLSTRKSSIDLSYTEPYFLDKDVAAGIDIFNVRQNNKSYSGYKHNILGFKLRSGYEVFDDFRHFSKYELRRDKIHDIDSNTSTYIKSQEGKSVTSMIGQGFQYDTLNDRLNPTEGHKLRLDLDFFGLGGNSKHITSKFKASKFYRLIEGVTAANFLEIGYIFPIKDVKINNRFFLNGDQVRGFKNSGIGPRDTSTGDALGGEQYAVIRNEINFPLGLPEELGIKGIVFGDAGILSKNSEIGTLIKDDYNLRASSGLGISWMSPFGLVKIFLAKALLEQSYDKTEVFRFSFGTTY